MPHRELGAEAMLDLARQAAELGEIFLLPDMPDLLAEMSRHLPVIALTNATLFQRRLLSRIEVLAGLPVALQISLDRPDADADGAMRARTTSRRWSWSAEVRAQLARPATRRGHPPCAPDSHRTHLGDSAHTFGGVCGVPHVCADGWPTMMRWVAPCSGSCRSPCCS